MIHTPKYLFQNKDNHGDAPAVSIKDSNGNWQTDSWKDYLNSVTSVAKSLLAAGIQKNDKVIFLAKIDAANIGSVAFLEPDIFINPDISFFPLFKSFFMKEMLYFW